MAHYQKFFEDADADGSGFLTEDELIGALKKNGYSGDDDTIKVPPYVDQHDAGIGDCRFSRFRESRSNHKRLLSVLRIVICIYASERQKHATNYRSVRQAVANTYSYSRAK